ncbi:MAG: type IV pilin [Archaeoglobaceae archaeon]
MEEIGTILMVAIVVVIAGVIVSYFYGFPSAIPQTKVPNIQIKRTGYTVVEFTLYDLGGAQRVHDCTVKYGGEEKQVVPTDSFEGVGSQLYCNDCGPGSKSLVFVCKVDDKGQVVLNAFI